MAVIFAQPYWEGRRCRVYGRLIRDYTVPWRVRTDNTLDGPGTILFAAGLPRFLSPYAEPNGFVDQGARMIDADPQQDQDDPFQWLVNYTYSSDLSHIAELANKFASPDGFKNQPKDGATSIGGNADQSALNPLFRPPQIKWGSVKFRKPIDSAEFIGTYLASGSQAPLTPQGPGDGTITALTTSAIEQFDPSVEIDDSRPTLTIVKNQINWDPALKDEYKDAVNSDEFYGFPAGTWKVDDMGADSAYENNVFFWVVTYIFHRRPEGWDINLLDAGFHQISADGQLQLVRDPTSGIPLASPALLDGNGNAQLCANPIPIYRRYRPKEYPRKPYAKLKLP
jgi:hypothetical protein